MSTPDTSQSAADDALLAFSFTVWNYKQGQMVSLMVQVGERLGLYRALDGAGAVTADDLAERTGLHPRWLLEWLRGQAAARLIDSPDGDHFELSEVAARVLARSDEVTYAAAAFDEERPIDYVTRLVEAFRSGIGLTYDDLGPSCAHHVERMLGPITRPEARIGIIFALVALAWMTRTELAKLPSLSALTDTGVAIFGALLLFFVPSGRGSGEKLIDWKTAERIPWGIAILFGGGLSLAAGMEATGLAAWIGDWIGR